MVGLAGEERSRLISRQSVGFPKGEEWEIRRSDRPENAAGVICQGWRVRAQGGTFPTAPHPKSGEIEGKRMAFPPSQREAKSWGPHRGLRSGKEVETREMQTWCGKGVPTLVLRKPGKHWGRGLTGMEKEDAGVGGAACLGCPGLGAQQGHGPAPSGILTLILAPQTSAL